MVSLPENLGFAGNCNAGMKETQDDDVVLSNDDVVALTPDWPARVQRAFAADDRIAAIGATSNYVLGRQLVRIPAPDGPELVEVDRLSFFWIAIRRVAWEDVGPLDEDFGLGLCEDLDWCIRAREKGWKLALDRGILVWHWGSQTIQRLGNYKQMEERNRALLAEKHPEA